MMGVMLSWQWSNVQLGRGCSSGGGSGGGGGSGLILSKVVP